MQILRQSWSAYVIGTTLVLSTLLGPAAFANQQPKKIAVILGGGDVDPASAMSSETRMATAQEVYGAVEASLPVLKQRGYSILASYNGHQPEITKKMQRKIGKPIQSFSMQNTDDTLKSVLKQIQDGTLGKGDQVLLHISTHGAPRKDTEVSHCIVLAEPSSQCLSLDELTYFRDELKAAGVRLAIVENTCFSGATIDLADDNTCIITSSNRYNPTLIDEEGKGFTSTLWELIQREKQTDLESAFLAARSEVTASSSLAQGLPEISTPAHRQLRPSFDDYFSTLSPDYYEDRAPAKNQCSLTPDQSAVRDVLKAALKSQLDRKQQWVESYDQDVKAYRSVLAKYNKIAKRLPMMTREGKPVPMASCIPFLESPNWAQDKTLAAHPYITVCSQDMVLSYMKKHLGDYKKLSGELSALQDRIDRAANQLVKVERSLYDQLYRQASEKTQNQPNPCRDFKL